jgi:hypothetical protein
MSGTNPPIDYQNQYGVSVFQTATGIEVGALDTKDIMLYGSKSFNIVNIPDAINKDLPFRHLLAIAPNDIPSNFAVNDIITIKDLDTNPNHIINIQSANAVGKHFGIKFEGTTPFIIEETTSTNGLTIQPETTFTGDINVGNINGSAYPPVVASDTLQDVLTAGNSATGASATITLTNNAFVASLTTKDLTFSGVSIRPIRFYSNGLPFNVSGTPNNVIFATPVISAMTAESIWKVDVAFYSSVVSARNLNSYVVADTNNLKVETNSVFGFSGGGFQTALPPNVPSPIGSYIKYTDTFEVDASAVGACRFYYTGGTSDGSTWTGNGNLSIVLTRLS